MPELQCTWKAEKAVIPTSVRFLKLRIGTRSGDWSEEHRVCSLSPNLPTICKKSMSSALIWLMKMIFASNYY